MRSAASLSSSPIRTLLVKASAEPRYPTTEPRGRRGATEVPWLH